MVTVSCSNVIARLLLNQGKAKPKIRHWGYQKGTNYGFENTKVIFVQIPYMTFFCVLKWVASKYGIAVDLQEESYTSKADCLAGDAILVYGKDKKDTKRVFSGK